MICAYVRLKLPLFISNDLPPRTTCWVQRHLVHCESCQFDLKTVQAFQTRLEQCITTPSSKTLEGFTEEVMKRMDQSTSMKSTSDRSMLDSLRFLFRPRLIFVGMFMILSCFALVRQAFIDELFRSPQMKPSVVTRDGAIVSEAQLRGHNAAINVVKDREGMVIIWLNTPTYKAEEARRG